MTMVKDSCRCVLSSSSSTTEDPPCNAQLICRDSRTSYCWKFGEMSASSDVVFVTSLEFKTMGWQCHCYFIVLCNVSNFSNFTQDYVRIPYISLRST
ncbi:uncharacterized protein TNCV_4870901 [Trichonephila clavipes]|nr:uncharacterized protein TNCV_4870901 [Trichonephila clavipes]